jgi:hypothetical protein
MLSRQLARGKTRADGEESLLEDDSIAQEADTRHDALRHTAGIGAQTRVRRNAQPRRQL